MRSVLHVITTINRGGAENHLASLVKGQRELGWTVAVAFLKGDGYWWRYLQETGARVEALSWHGYADLEIVNRLCDTIRAVQPAIVHAHLPAAEVLTRLALARLKKRPALVISKHSNDPFIGSPLFWLAGYWAERGADRIIAISGAVRSYLLRQHRVSTAKVEVVHYGLDPEPFETVTQAAVLDLRRVWHVPPEAVLIGTVCRIERQKRIDVLMRGFAVACKSHPQLRLVVVGAGSEERALRGLASNLHVEDKVTWAGRRSDIPTVMCALDVFSLCSDYEGFGLVLLEAMAAGRPIVATRVSAIPEIVVNGETGILCAREDHVGVAEAFSRLTDASTRAQYGQAGRARLLSRFAPQTMVRSTLKLYERTLDSR